MSRSKHFPTDRELDDIKQLLGARTIHIHLGIKIDESWQGSAASALIDNPALREIQDRMYKLYGKYAVEAASQNDLAYRSMYDTAMMRIWWEKFGGTVELRGSADVGEAGGRLGSVDGTDANTPAQPHEEGDGG